MFTGLNDLDWARLWHYAGPADDVPTMLRDLAGDDPEAREGAICEMWGYVHHQGDVYDSTVAAIPFLIEVATAPGRPGRGEVGGLLASIGYAWALPAPDGLAAQARELMAQARPQLAALLADPDPEVRRQAPATLLVARDDDETVFRLLRERLPAEPDTAARVAIVHAIAQLGKRSPGLPVTGWLTGLAGAGDPRVRLATTVRSGVSIGAAELAGIFEAAYRSAGPAGLPEEETEHLAGLLGDWPEQRTGERAAVLLALLRMPGQPPRRDAIRPAGELMGAYRGDYAELVHVLGEQLEDPQLAPRVLHVLARLGDLAAPAADAVARGLDGTAGSPGLQILAELRDPRVLPVLGRLLDEPDVPHQVGGYLAFFGPAAVELLPVLRRRLPDTAGRWAYDGLIAAIGAIGPAAVPALPELLAQEPTPPMLTVLGRFGPAGTAAVPLLSGLLDHPAADWQLAAAQALWRITGDPGPVLPVLTRRLDDDWPGPALVALAELGPDAVALAGRFSALATDPAAAPGLRSAAAYALWRATGALDPVLRVLGEVWAAQVYCRRSVAEYLAEIGPAAAGLASLPAEEQARHRRAYSGSNNYEIRSDEELLRACAAALAAIRS